MIKVTKTKALGKMMAAIEKVFGENVRLPDISRLFWNNRMVVAVEKHKYESEWVAHCVIDGEHIMAKNDDDDLMDTVCFCTTNGMLYAKLESEN